MGTNFYYLPSMPCGCCGREYPEKHVGKASRGWKFTLHAEDREDTWEKLKTRLQSAVYIRDEYDDSYNAEDMIRIVEEWQDGKAHPDYYRESSWRDPQGYIMCSGEFF